VEKCEEKEKDGEKWWENKKREKKERTRW